MLAQSGSDSAAAAGIGGFLLLLIGFGIVAYFIPTVIAVMRKHSQTVPIVAVNILLGWTFLGWVVALVWSLTADKAPVVVQQTFGAPPPAGPPFNGPQKVCPHCYSSIPAQASVCRSCQRDVASASTVNPQDAATIQTQLPPPL